MSSESDEEDFVSYGTPLEELNEDTIPKKKALTVEDQVAKDKHGRRRFHGAFTGGFSAGFFNSVGSLEGWKPTQFKSSRSSKSKTQFQRPEDFMDDEDMDEFGIAPKVLRAQGNYRQDEGPSRKRPVPQFSDGPITGTPVLKTLIEPVRETIGIRLLKKMGWKPGQGVGPRLSKSEKLASKQCQNQRKVYGCAMPNQGTALRDTEVEDSEDEEDEDDTDVTFAPDDFEPWIVKPKDDSFGLGYSGLDRRPVLSSHIDLFGPPTSSLVMNEKKKKVNIRGQAFGVGAFEAEDEDIYATEDMSRYDFALDTPQMLAEKRLQERNKKQSIAVRSSGVLEGFMLSSTVVVRKTYPPPTLPPGFNSQHEVKSSRFSDPKVTTDKGLEKLKVTDKRLTAAERAVLVNEPEAAVKAQPVLTPAVERTTSSFRPFVSDPEKQERYEKYLTLSKQGQAEKLKDLQPFSMTEWEREREKVEFEQASKLYRPLSAAFSDRFVQASAPDDATDPLVPVARTTDADQDVKGAAKLKMFGKLTRRIGEWTPCNTLCKRFNIPPPRGGGTSVQAKTSRPKFSVFNFLDAAPFNKPASALASDEEGGSVETLTKNDSLDESQESRISAVTPMETSPTEPTPAAEEDEPFSSKDDDIEKLANSTSKMDLYKAIFLSSSDESDGGGDDSKASASEKQHLPTASEQNVLRNTSPPRGIFANLDFDTLNKPKLKSPNHKSPELAKEVNVVRNTSPPRGIFANLDLDSLNRHSTSKNSTEGKNQPEINHSKQSSEKISEGSGLFGPSLPSNLRASNSEAIETSNTTSFRHENDMYGPAVPSKPVSTKSKVSVVNVGSSSDSEDDWVEMNNSSDSEKSDKHSSRKKHSKKSHRKSKKHKEKKHKHKKKRKK